MADIIDRLRNDGTSWAQPLFSEAAAEIERLRAKDAADTARAQERNTAYERDADADNAEIDRLKRERDGLLAWQRARLQQHDQMNAEIERMRAALILAEDVLSRAPYSTEMWPNGMHPQAGIGQIRDALEPAVPGAGQDRTAELERENEWLRKILDDARHYAAVCPVPDALTGPARIEMLERRARIANGAHEQEVRK